MGPQRRMVGAPHQQAQNTRAVLSCYQPETKLRGEVRRIPEVPKTTSPPPAWPCTPGAGGPRSPSRRVDRPARRGPGDDLADLRLLLARVSSGYVSD